MRALVVFCHPCEESYNAAIGSAVLHALERAGHDVQYVDLYKEEFDPVMGAHERRLYHEPGKNEDPIRDQVAQILWSEMLVFVYPTWWYGLPAMLKGWLDRVWVPHVTFEMPDENQPMRSKMQHIKKIAVVTTCGATWWLSKLVGEPGKKTIIRGIRLLCAKNCRTMYLALYKMDTCSSQQRQQYLEKVERKLAKF
ncbi:MAG: NAD(P)H-dependent oxidoreductase [Stappiaceae bacterium]